MDALISGLAESSLSRHPKDGLRIWPRPTRSRPLNYSNGAHAVKNPLFYPADQDSFEQILQSLTPVLEPDLRLPDWPFKIPVGSADICQYGLAIAGSFGPVMQALVDEHADDSVSLVSFEPTPVSYREGYGRYAAFTTSAQSIAETFWELVNFEPDDEFAGSVTDISNVVGIVGSSGKWAVWAERWWDVAIVVSHQTGGAWLSAGVDFASAEEALHDFIEPEFEGALPEADRRTFLEYIRTRGTLA